MCLNSLFTNISFTLSLKGGNHFLASAVPSLSHRSPKDASKGAELPWEQKGAPVSPQQTQRGSPEGLQPTLTPSSYADWQEQ